jgi:hypothetical protein
MDRIKLPGFVALAAAAWGLRARPRPPLTAAQRARVLLLACGVIGWLWWLGVSVETQVGFSGNDRYLVLGTSLISIAGGVGVGWAVAAVIGILRRRIGAVRRLGRGMTISALGSAAGLAILLVAPRWVGPSVLNVPRTHRALVYQAHLRTDLSRAIRSLGGARRVLRCGTVMAEGFQVPMVAYALGVRILRVEAQPNPPPGQSAPPPWPNVIFQTRDTSHAALLPLASQIIAWEHDGAHYRFQRFRTFFVFTDCGHKVAG